MSGQTKQAHPNLTITGEEFAQLDQLIGQIPTKFGLPLVQFFQAVQQRRLNEEKQAEEKAVAAEQEG